MVMLGARMVLLKRYATRAMITKPATALHTIMGKSMPYFRRVKESSHAMLLLRVLIMETKLVRNYLAI